MFVLPQSRPARAAPFGRIPTVDRSGRGVPLVALASTPDHVLRAKFPAIANAQDHFANLGGSRFSLKIMWAGYEGMNFTEDMRGASLVKGVALAFDRFLRESPAFAGHPPSPTLRPNHYALHDLVLTGIITFGGNVFQAEVQVASQSRACAKAAARLAIAAPPPPPPLPLPLRTRCRRAGHSRTSVSRG
ncbi:hypothetical protein LXA43DRAFT_1066990 [Ganoderma leucocontextum]|nr:hypothetical protein LXA43DRAFT_1066990 [Ganoderma leucocontextum]